MLLAGVLGSRVRIKVIWNGGAIMVRWKSGWRGGEVIPPVPLAIRAM